MQRARHYTAATLAVAVLSLFFSSQSSAHRVDGAESPVVQVETPTTDESVRAVLGLGPRPFATTAVDTTFLYSEDFEGLHGWTEVDLTAQSGTYFHVDDYAGLSFGPLKHVKSLWCGLRASEALCDYATLPGYGNGWDQAFCTKLCNTYSGTVAVDYKARWDVEPGYDYIQLENSLICSDFSGWTPFTPRIDGVGAGFRHDTFAAPVTPTKIRFRVVSDGAWSDQDGFWPTNGALHVDSLCVRDASGIRITVEDFEGEANGSTTSNDWMACNTPGYGSPAFVTYASGMVQEDPCVMDISRVWAFFQNSTSNYACGGYPAQATVPYKSVRGQYLNNDIWSPPIELTGTGGKLLMRYSVYRDLPLDALIFYRARVRAMVDGCWGPWGGTSITNGGNGDWLTTTLNVTQYASLGTATHVQVGFNVSDMCISWCGAFGSGECHSHSPLFDNVSVMRLDESGPQWSIRDIDQFQDNFPQDGTLTGTVRADMANSILLTSNPAILPGDSSVVTVLDAVDGIANDGALGGKKIYAYVHVSPTGQLTKTGANLSGGSRWPFAGTQVIGGKTWTLLRLDACLLNGNPVADKFCIDLNDALFTRGDVVSFFYGAESTTGVRTYASGTSLSMHVDDVNEAAANASEFTCLPLPDYPLLYVDGMDGRGGQPYWELMNVIFPIDNRFDIRGAASSVGNRLAGRVINIANQLAETEMILWDCGDLETAIGDGTSLGKPDDYALLNQFLADLPVTGGVYLSGDDVGERLYGATGPSAIDFRTTYLPYTLSASSHITAFGISPLVIGIPAGCFHASDFVVAGSCPLFNDFDAFTPNGGTTMEMSYGGPAANNGAVIAKKTTNAQNKVVTAVMSGFSVIYIRDDEADDVTDRLQYFYDIVECLSDEYFWIPELPSDAPPVARNTLSQNYPNPFNPTTTIAFSLKERGAASLEIYDVSGRLVRTLAAEELPAGSHVKVWDGRDNAGQASASGVYFYKLAVTGFSQTKKMVLLK